MSDDRMREIAAQFRKDMQKLGLGVSMQAGDGPMVEVIPPPCLCGHPHRNGRSGPCCSRTCQCKGYRERESK